VRNPKIQLVCFTGSVAGGLAVQRAASDRVAIRVGLELGGKDPAYVRQDVDVKWAAEEIVDGAIFNSGQSCCSLERIYVAEEVHDEFVKAVQDVLEGYTLGDPNDPKTNIGPVVSKRSAETIRAHIQDALDKGAKDATPENASFKSPPPDGNYVAPTLLTGCTHEMTVMTEETFGPVIPVMKVRSDMEAIKMMNDSNFGLTASIWTRDVDKGHELADDVEAGTVFVNRCDYPSPVSWNLRSIHSALSTSCLGRASVQFLDGALSTSVKFLREICLSFKSSCFELQRRSLEIFLAVGNHYLGQPANNSQDLAWIGWKDSGKGQTLSKFGFDQFVKLKSYHIKDYPK
jgi:acyl-CoA reductase-like NAD-dependent aldehyde dehydrogenase